METTPFPATPFPATAPPVLLTLADVAAVLRCTRRTVERQIADRRLRVLKIGRAVRVEPDELARFLACLRDHAG
ncbi:MAG: helix-turn-helix domain-containing protein [Actinomycetales bacterium]|nr:helix-turn-helix domain-containing protein [Actinomycetales bacterium]